MGYYTKDGGYVDKDNGFAMCPKAVESSKKAHRAAVENMNRAHFQNLFDFYVAQGDITVTEEDEAKYRKPEEVRKAVSEVLKKKFG